MKAIDLFAGDGGVKGHVVSMQSEGWRDGRPVQSVAVCECGWRNTVAWGEYAAQDHAIYSHWMEQHEYKFNAQVSRPCPDCGAKVGEQHNDWCDVERCPDCGGQLISCDCECKLRRNYGH